MHPITVTVTVTPEDIAVADQQRREDKEFFPPCQCPTARALRRLFPDQSIAVGIYYLHIGGKPCFASAELTGQIVAWTNEEGFQPGSYEFTPLNEKAVI